MTNQRNDPALIDRFLATRDPGLREEIILNYIPLLHYVLGRLGLTQSLGADYEDFLGQGLIGLIEAVDNYNPNAGAQLSTYATLRVRGQVIDYLRQMDWLPRGARQRARAVQEANDQLWSRLEREPTDQEMADHLGYDLNTLKQALVDSSRVMLSLETTTLPGEEGNSLHEILPDESQHDPFDILNEREHKDRLVSAIQSLPKRQQILLSLYYDEELTYKEIGEVLGLSESRICQLHSKAIMDLRSLLSGENVLVPDESKARRKLTKPAQPSLALPGR
jgi:RNA polymerase sigma factor FliA